MFMLDILDFIYLELSGSLTNFPHSTALHCFPEFFVDFNQITVFS